MKHLKAVVVLVVLQGVIDYLFVFLYPNVNPIRATLIGLTALVVLYALPFKRFFNIQPLAGALSIYSSALFGALLVQAGTLTSKSPLSAAAHIAILVATYAIITYIRNYRTGRNFWDA